MVALFQIINNMSFLPSMQKVKPSVTAKWIPVNKSFITLCKIVLRSAVERFGLAHAAITLRSVTHQGYRHLLLVNDERELKNLPGPVEEFLISTQEANSSPFEDFVADAAFSIALNVYSPKGLPQRLGYLVVQAGPGKKFQQTEIDQQLQQLAEEIIHIISRYQTRYRALHLYEDQHYWVGNSKALRQLDQRIDLLAKGSQPVLIRGNKGSGKIIAARSLHCMSCTQSAPFVESDCKDWSVGTAAKVLHSLCHSAAGGTLFLRNVNMLFSTDFLALRNTWRRIASDNFEGRPALRWVMTLSRKDTELASYQAHWLDEQTEELVLPDLAERQEDRRDLAQFYLGQFAINHYCDLTEAAWQLWETTDSLTNVEQLKNVIQRLTLIAEDDLITLDDLQNALE